MEPFGVCVCVCVCVCVVTTGEVGQTETERWGQPKAACPPLPFHRGSIGRGVSQAIQCASKVKWHSALRASRARAREREKRHP